MELYVTQGLSTFGSALLYTGCCQILTCIRIQSLQCDSGPLYSHCQKLQRIEYKTTRPSIPPVHTEKGDRGADQIIHQSTNPFTTACLRRVQVQSKANTNTRAFNSPQIYWLISTVLKYGNSISYPPALLYHTCVSGVTRIRAPALSPLLPITRDLSTLMRFNMSNTSSLQLLRSRSLNSYPYSQTPVAEPLPFSYPSITFA